MAWGTAWRPPPAPCGWLRRGTWAAAPHVGRPTCPTTLCCAQLEAHQQLHDDVNVASDAAEPPPTTQQRASSPPRRSPGAKGTGGPASADADAQERQRAADEQFMRMALLRAEQAAEQGEIPVGAVLVAPDGATVLACTGNLTHTRRNPVAHAELLAVSEAAERLGGWRLLGTTLYCTLEPCPMCAGAILQARIGRLVYGARQPLLGADGSWVSLFPPEPGPSTDAAHAAAAAAAGPPQERPVGAGGHASPLPPGEGAQQGSNEAPEGTPTTNGSGRGSRAPGAGRRARSPSPGDGAGAAPAAAQQQPVHPFHRGITVTRGVLAEESAAMLKAFFRRRRQEQAASRVSSPGTT